MQTIYPIHLRGRSKPIFYNNTIKCGICEKEMAKSPISVAAHYGAHQRRGEATLTDKLRFMKANGFIVRIAIDG